MARKALHTIVSITGGVLTGGGVYWTGVEPLAAPVGVCVAIAGLMLFHLRREYPGRATGGHWSDDRWGGVTAPILGAVAGLGIYSLPVDLATRFAVGALVALVGIVGYVGGILDEMERRPTAENDETAATAVEG